MIRHGRPVEHVKAGDGEIFNAAASLIKEIQSRGHITIAVICRSQGEADEVNDGLAPLVRLSGQKDGGFANGVMVLPVNLTKGLEFDAVILWKPDESHYGCNPKDAKLFYVAVTRALHELYLLGDEMTGLVK